MQCPHCGSEYPDSASHCTHCGTAFTDASGTLSAVEREDLERELATALESLRRLRRYVPVTVAEGVLHDRQRLKGERREVAVLFADAVNFTHLTASLDAEPVFNLINDLLGRLVTCVHRYDGVVDKFTGDGLMAVFGAPIAHENDPELAVRAALDMQRAVADFESVALAHLGAPVELRIGIHSGPAVAGIIGTEEQAAYTVIGETVNVAARLESEARSGSILVSFRVFQQTRALFNFQARGSVNVKGIDQPIAVYVAAGDRSEPLPTRGFTGVADVILGRDAELEQLSSFFKAFLDDHRGRLVIIRGEAGLGKSRLVSEVFSGTQSDGLAVWQGRGLPYAQGVGYGMFRSLLQDVLRAQPTDTAWDTLVSPTLRPLLRQVLGQNPASDEQYSLRYLEPERLKQLTALALREWLWGETQRRPVVLILEDFHWADDLSRDMWKSLVNLTQEAPLLLCVVTRLQSEAALQLGIPAVEEPPAATLSLLLDLKPLSQEHSRELLGHLVDLASLPEQLVHTILTRAEGNPLYIEEFVRMLIEKEVLALAEGQWRVSSAVAMEQLEIPTSLRGLMMARVDRLPEDLQHVLRTAAVIGLEFNARLVESVENRLRGQHSVRPLLERLTDLGVLIERPEVGGQVYAFGHLLTQETVYNSLMRTQRPGLHRTVAECIEALYADDLDGHVEVLALHYDRARVRNKAMHYMLLAGERARKRFANREATEYYERALQLSQHLSGCHAERWRAVVGLGTVQQHVGDYEEATACYEAALEEWAAATPEARAEVMLRLGDVWDKRGGLQEAEKWLHEGLAQLDPVGGVHADLRARFFSELGWLNWRRGDLNGAQEWLERGLALVSETEHLDVLSSVLNRLGAVHYSRNEWDRAVACVSRALELRQQLGDVVGYARSLNNLGILKQESGDWKGALADYERAADLHERIGEVEGLALACTNQGVVYTEQGEWTKAGECLRRSLTIAQRIGHPYELAQAHMNLGRLYLMKGSWQASALHLNAAIPLYEDAGAHASLNLNRAYHLQARLHLEQGQADTALDWAQQSCELLHEVTGAEEGESVEWGLYEQLMGSIAQAQGDLTAARRHLDRSSAILDAKGSWLEAGRTDYYSGALWLELGEVQKAREALSRARERFGQLGAAADLQRVDHLLAQIHEPEDGVGVEQLS